MEVFRTKAVGVAGTLGERFRLLREETGLSTAEVGEKIHVNPKYLTAIESGAYHELPGAVYARNFVRQYAHFLNVREAAALEIFNREYAIALKLAPPEQPDEPRPTPLSRLLSPRGIRRSIILLLATAVLVYLAVEVRNATSAPTLVISAPPDQLTTTERSVELVGTTVAEASVTANGRVIQVDRNGSFHDTLDLQDGLNTIVIRAVKKRGGETSVVRNILVTTDNNSNNR
ncbi:MAG: helix-turn-helix domain-containing protein [Candidatus Kerfeldbacteria bacterium]|nr:helix-turn-helix domain-containing protein [Candidatus Kerfeldbacteria bacterium]